MPDLMNCWEHKKCGRQPGGQFASSLGECPAATCEEADGTNRGKNGGRICWAIAGTLCGGEVQGTMAAKLENCLRCDFYSKVAAEEASVELTLSASR